MSSTGRFDSMQGPESWASEANGAPLPNVRSKLGTNSTAILQSNYQARTSAPADAESQFLPCGYLPKTARDRHLWNDGRAPSSTVLSHPPPPPSPVLSSSITSTRANASGSRFKGKGFLATESHNTPRTRARHAALLARIRVSAAPTHPRNPPAKASHTLCLVEGEWPRTDPATPETPRSPRDALPGAPFTLTKSSCSVRRTEDAPPLSVPPGRAVGPKAQEQPSGLVDPPTNPPAGGLESRQPGDSLVEPPHHLLAVGVTPQVQANTPSETPYHTSDEGTDCPLFSTAWKQRGGSGLTDASGDTLGPSEHDEAYYTAQSDEAHNSGPALEDPPPPPPLPFSPDAPTELMRTLSAASISPVAVLRPPPHLDQQRWSRSPPLTRHRGTPGRRMSIPPPSLPSPPLPSPPPAPELPLPPQLPMKGSPLPERPPPPYAAIRGMSKAALQAAPPGTNSSVERKSRRRRHSTTSAGTPSSSGGSRNRLSLRALLKLVEEFAEPLHFPEVTGDQVLSDNESVGSFYTKRRVKCQPSYVTPAVTKAHGRTRPTDRDVFYSNRSVTAMVIPEGSGSDEEAVNKGGSARLDDTGTLAATGSRRKRAVPLDAAGAVINPHTSAYNGLIDLLRQYVNLGGNLEARDRFQATPLLLCSERGHLEGVRLLLGAGADLSAVDENDYTALHLCAYYGQLDVLRLLLQCGAAPLALDHRGRTPRQLASNRDICRVLARAERQSSAPNGGAQANPAIDLLDAVEHNQVDAVRAYLLDRSHAARCPQRLDQRGRHGMTALHLACFHGFFHLVHLLVRGGADPNLADDFGETPLHLACQGGSPRIIQALLAAGADPMIVDHDGRAPVECCTKLSRSDVHKFGKGDVRALLCDYAHTAVPKNIIVLRSRFDECEEQLNGQEDALVQMGVGVKEAQAALRRKSGELNELAVSVSDIGQGIREVTASLKALQHVAAELGSCRGRAGA